MDHTLAPKAAAGGNGGGGWDNWPPSDDEEFWPRRVVQKKLGICKSKLYKMIEDGILPPPIKIGSSTLFRKSQIVAYQHAVIEGMRNNPSSWKGSGVPRQPKNKK